MRFKSLLWVVVLVFVLSITLSAQAQTPLKSLRYGKFGLSYEATLANSVSIFDMLAEDSTTPDIMIAQPARTEILLYNRVPDAPNPNWFDPTTVAVIYVYKMDALTGYETSLTEANEFQALLTTRPDLTPYMAVENNMYLPYLPFLNAAQVFRARASYVDLATISGVVYLSFYAQGIDLLTQQSRLFYIFQGMSKDGQYYVSALFPVTNTLLPTEIPADFNWEEFSATYMTYLDESVTLFNNAAPTDFAPDLATLDTIIQSMYIED